jgi:glycosyltransferase involved in cell wall biosynthesis
MRRRRLLVLATYPRSAAATRFRACAYFDALASHGIDAELHPFLDDEFFLAFYRPDARMGKALGLVRASLERVRLLLNRENFDAVFVQREAALWGPAIVETILARVKKIPIVFDFDDAIWVEESSTSRYPWLARLLKAPRKTNQLLRIAAEVIAGSRYLAEYALRFTDRVIVSPTVVSRASWVPLPGRLDGGLGTTDGKPIIGWVGTHSTARFLDIVLPALRTLASEGEAFRLRLVGASRSLPIDGIEVESVPWSEAGEISDFQRIDVGIAPMPDTPWTRGKCGFKQVQYMAVGVPFVSSPVGGAVDIVRHGENGLFANSSDEWRRWLGALLRDRALRARLAQAGRADAEASLCTEAQAEAVIGAIERAMRQ